MSDFDNFKLSLFDKIIVSVSFLGMVSPFQLPVSLGSKSDNKSLFISPCNLNGSIILFIYISNSLYTDSLIVFTKVFQDISNSSLSFPRINFWIIGSFLNWNINPFSVLLY